MLSGARIEPGDEEAPETPPALRERIEDLRAEKEAAIDAGDFGRAASIRDSERRLVRRALTSPGEAPPLPRVRSLVGHELPYVYGSRTALFAALAVAAIGFPLGLLVGWLIWG
jgi:UvrB/uvrC motif